MIVSKNLGLYTPEGKSFRFKRQRFAISSWKRVHPEAQSRYHHCNSRLAGGENQRGVTPRIVK